MPPSEKLKEKIHAHCRELVSAKIEAHRQALLDLKEGMSTETKSSAGDKFETARAMVHIEQDNIRRQLVELIAQSEVLNAIEPAIVAVRAGLGSLIRTELGYYFLSTALGKIAVNGQIVFTLSLQSPLGAMLLGSQAGDVIRLNGRQQTIHELI